MITLTPPHQPLFPAALQAADGFAWWYVDLIDDAGNGLVCILASGLPFLPGPVRLPSLNLAVYAKGEQVFYVLHELNAEDAVFPEDGSDREIRVGRTSLCVSRDNGRISIRVAVDVDVPGVARAQGTIDIEGVARVPSAPEAQASELGGGIDHEWSPQTGPCRGRADLTLDGETVVVAGRGYYDRNGSQRPLRSLGIDRWWWCRVALENADGPLERIAYVLWPGTGGPPLVLGLSIDSQGTTTLADALTLEVPRRRRTLYGMELFEHVRLHAPDGGVFIDVKNRALVDNGPFYLRGLLNTGVFEHVAPHRIDLPHHRPFVAQRVARASSSTLPFLLPYFTGHSASRVRRMLSFWQQRWFA